MALTLLSIAQAVFNTQSTDIYLIALCGAVLIFFASWFYSIINDLLMFSKATNTLISIGLAVILSTTGILAKIINYIINAFGYIWALVIIFLFFTSSYFLEHLTLRKMRKNKEFREQLEKERGETFIKELGKIK